MLREDMQETGRIAANAGAEQIEPRGKEAEVELRSAKRGSYAGRLCS
jgi:hypothetical protein